MCLTWSCERGPPYRLLSSWNSLSGLLSELASIDSCGCIGGVPCAFLVTLICASAYYTRNCDNRISWACRFCLFLYFSYTLPIFRGGATVAQLAVNELVVGSNPTRGAKNRCKKTPLGVFLFWLRGRNSAAHCFGRIRKVLAGAASRQSPKTRPEKFLERRRKKCSWEDPPRGADLTFMF